jgi:hypothetical protein
MSQTTSCLFRIICHGHAELPEDNPIYGTYWIESFLHLGDADGLTPAMLLVERYASERERYPLEGALDFRPHRVLIRDRREALVLGGCFGGEHIEWIAPVAPSDARAHSLRSEIQRLRSEASFERGWDNYSTAKGLESRADLLELPLVDAFWYAAATLAVMNAAYRARFRAASHPYETSKTHPVIEAWSLFSGPTYIMH